MNEIILSSPLEQHEYYMRLALQEAQKAYDIQEVPVGAVIVSSDNQVIATGHNRTIIDSDPTAHAEVVALRKAALLFNNYRLPNLRLYVTLEPCLMCMGAMFHARLSQVVFGAFDAKTGVCASVMAVQEYKQLNHHAQVVSGILQDECAQILKTFFKERRVGKKSNVS